MLCAVTIASGLLRWRIQVQTWYKRKYAKRSIFLRICVYTERDSNLV